KLPMNKFEPKGSTASGSVGTDGGGRGAGGAFNSAGGPTLGSTRSGSGISTSSSRFGGSAGRRRGFLGTWANAEPAISIKTQAVKPMNHILLNICIPSNSSVFPHCCDQQGNDPKQHGA